MTIPGITGVRLGGSADLPLLVCGPSLGTSATALWSSAAALLADHFQVVAWDLPGHGHNRAEVTDAFTMAELAEGVLSFVEGVLSERGERDGSWFYAGDSVGGAVGQHLLLDHPGRLGAAVLVCTAARFGDEAMWRERAELVRASGTSAMVEGSAQRWFGPGFIDEEPDVAATLLQSLRDADRAGYAAVCDALAAFDMRDELSRIDVPVFAVAGAYDVAAPVAAMAELAHGVADGRLIVLDRVGHLAPAEAPADTARVIREAAGLGQADTEPRSVGDRGAAGMAVRRDVLGDEHVDRATAAATDLTREFQEFITDYAWGGIWTRPGLDRRSRSMITLTALIARGHHEELALHLRAARTNGLSDDEIKEVILQSAIYCGVPDANTAFRIAQRTLEELDGRDAR
ncbi:MAG TPA: 4-carboxymuconolactone decarboxylase [Nocardioidaceae bacterium]|nr:4-carboxymuconolactone decarboxylase [Nocardioidaceae bacterium]